MAKPFDVDFHNKRHEARKIFHVTVAGEYKIKFHYSHLSSLPRFCEKFSIETSCKAKQKLLCHENKINVEQSFFLGCFAFPPLPGNLI
jgi:hypothetical protein